MDGGASASVYTHKHRYACIHTLPVITDVILRRVGRATAPAATLTSKGL